MASTTDDPRYVRTTVSLREDLYQRLKRQELSLSDAINDVLARSLERDHRLFDSAPPSSREDIRDHDDRV